MSLRLIQGVPEQVEPAPPWKFGSAIGVKGGARLHNRGEDAPEIIDLRLQNAADEMAQAKEFDGAFP
jgi:hypothetical protein